MTIYCHGILLLFPGVERQLSTFLGIAVEQVDSGYPLVPVSVKDSQLAFLRLRLLQHHPSANITAWQPMLPRVHMPRREREAMIFTAK